MSQIEKIGVSVGSRRYARDLIDDKHSTYTKPWWDVEDTFSVVKQLRIDRELYDLCPSSFPRGQFRIQSNL